MKYVLDFSSGTTTKELFVSSVLQVKFGFGEIFNFQGGILENHEKTLRNRSLLFAIFGTDAMIPVHSAACCNPQKGLNETSLAYKEFSIHYFNLAFCLCLFIRARGSTVYNPLFFKGSDRLREEPHSTSDSNTNVTDRKPNEA